LHSGQGIGFTSPDKTPSDEAIGSDIHTDQGSPSLVFATLPHPSHR
jgi:hypothetical protein